MKPITSVRLVCLLLVVLAGLSCSRNDLLYLLPEGSADVVNQYFDGPSYGNSRNGGSGHETSGADLELNLGVLFLLDIANLLDFSTLRLPPANEQQPAFGSLLASNRPGLLPGQFRPYGPARPTAAGSPFRQHLALMSGLELVGKGGHQTAGGSTDRTRLLYLNVPVYALYQQKLAANKGEVFGGLGPYLAYGLAGSFKSTGGGASTSFPAFGNNGGFRRFDAGLTLTAGYQLPSSLRLRLAYDIGLANIESGRGDDKTHNRALSFNVAYPLAKIVDKLKKH